MEKPQLIPTGRVLVTPGALDTLGDDWTRYLKRHIACDWSEMDEEDQKANRRALERGERILSAYWHGKIRVWVITEADRSATTVLLSDEY